MQWPRPPSARIRRKPLSSPSSMAPSPISTNRKTVMIVADLSVGNRTAGWHRHPGLQQVSFPGLGGGSRHQCSIGQAFHRPAMMASRYAAVVPEKRICCASTRSTSRSASVAYYRRGTRVRHPPVIPYHRIPLRDVPRLRRSPRGRGGLALAKIPTVADETAENQHVLANLRDGWKALCRQPVGSSCSSPASPSA